MRSGSKRFAARWATLALLLGGVTEARGEDGVEPSYGRIDGDVTLVGGVGGVIAAGGPRVTAEIRARYLETAGVFASYEDGALVSSGADPNRLAAAGFELRPLFFFRWLRGHETSRARWDLVLDSMGLELGITFQEARGESFSSRPGVQAGLGLEFPILPAASGPWLGFHGGLRWSDRALASGVVDSTEDRQAYVSITLAWHQVLATHIVDVGDRPP